MARKPLPAEYTPTVANVLKVWHAASDADRAAGAEWYNDAHALACEISDANTGAGVIAALSPQVSWPRNVTMALQVSRGETPTMTNGRNATKAARCMSGELWQDVLGGSKVRSFAATIENPAHPTAVVIDRHAFDIAIGQASSDRDRGLILSRAGVHERFARVYVAAARILGVAPSVVQAATWIAWRHAKGIVD